MAILDAFITILGFSVILVLGASILQLISRQREISQIRDSVRCLNCGHHDLKVRISFINLKSGSKVSLPKNIGGGLICLSLAMAFFRWFAIVVTDLVVGSNTTGVQDQSLISQIGLWSFFLIIGIGFVIQGILLIIPYAGKKEKSFILTCNACEATYMLDSMYSHQVGMEDDLLRLETISIPQRSAPITSPEPKEITASPNESKENLEPCKNCGILIETFELTCPHCGHTQWGVIGILAVLSILVVGFVVTRAMGGNASGAIFWGGSILGALFLTATIYSVFKAIKVSGSRLPATGNGTGQDIPQLGDEYANPDALPKMQGILVLSRRAMEQAVILKLTQQILDAQRSRGYAVADGFEASHVAAGDDIDNDMFAYAKLRALFSKFGDAEIGERVKVFPFEFPVGEVGKFYVLYDRPHHE